MNNTRRLLTAHLTMASSYWGQSLSLDAASLSNLSEEEDLAQMLRGMRAYQTHDYQSNRAPLEALWHCGEVQIKTIPAHVHRPDQPTLLLIPSLINKSYILDLMPERSMLRYMSAQGLNTYLLDWGDSLQDEGQRNIESIVLNRLVPALKFLAQHTGAPLHALGYCMGGTLLTGAAIHAQDFLKSLTFLAAPWDFHGGSQSLLKRVEYWAPAAFPMIEARGFLPLDYIQTLFASLDPEMTAQKFTRFLHMEPNSQEAHLFIAVEDWLNDGVDLPSGVAQNCILDWFVKNTTARGQWALQGRNITPEDIQTPSLVVASDKDRLVELDCARHLYEALPHATHLNPACGHIGMIAGRSCTEEVWHPIAEWINEL